MQKRIDPDADTIFKPTDMLPVLPTVKDITSLIDALIHIGKGLLLYLMQALAFPVEVILRYKFGERYLTIPTALIGVVGPAALLYPSKAMMVVPLVALAAFAWHKLQIRLRNRRGEEWYSKCWGIPWIPYEKFDKSGLRREFLWEPAIVSVPGAILAVMGNQLGFVLLGSAAALIVKQWIWRSEIRRKILDQVDAKIEAENLELAIGKEDVNPLETHGLVIPGAADWSPRERRTIADAYGSVDLRLQELFERDAEPNEAA